MSEHDEVVVLSESRHHTMQAEATDELVVLRWRDGSPAPDDDDGALTHAEMDTLTAWWLKRQGVDVEALRAERDRLRELLARIRPLFKRYVVQDCHVRDGVDVVGLSEQIDAALGAKDGGRG